MSSRSQLYIILLIIMSMSLKWHETKAQASSSSCTSVLISMSSCLNYISGKSSTPASSCCSTLASVVQSQPQCLCAVLSSGAASSLGVTINQTRALELPASCNVQTPPVSKCNGGGGSGGPTSSGAAAAAAAPAPTGVPDEEPEAPSADFPNGSSKTVPGSASDGSIMRESFGLMAFVISCTSVLAII